MRGGKERIESVIPLRLTPNFHDFYCESCSLASMTLLYVVQVSEAETNRRKIEKMSLIFSGRCGFDESLRVSFSKCRSSQACLVVYRRSRRDRTTKERERSCRETISAFESSCASSPLNAKRILALLRLGDFRLVPLYQYESKALQEASSGQKTIAVIRAFFSISLRRSLGL